MTGDQGTEGDDQETEVARLTALERAAAIALGFLVAGLAFWLITNPPQVDKIGTSEKTGPIVLSVDAEVGTIGVVLVGISAIAVLMGLLGVRFNKFSVGNTSAESTTSTVTEAPKTRDREGEERPTAALSQRTSPVGDVEAWDDLPTWAQSALVDWQAQTGGSALPIREAIAQVEKEPGQGNKAMYVTVAMSPGGEDAKRLKVTTGQGSASAKHADK